MNVEGRMTIAKFHRARCARKFHSFILLFASCLFAVGGLAASIELQGQNKGDTNTWTMNNLSGWGELEYIPCRVFFKSGPVVNQSITIFFPHLRGTTPGIQNLSDFAPSPNAVITSAPVLATDPSGTWSYTFKVSITNSSSGFVRFRARLAAGAHLNSGSSLQLDGDPQSMGQLQIHKPGPGAALPDLAIVKTGPLTIPQGGIITYTLAYTNKDGAITNTGMGVQICDILPPELVVNPDTLPSGGELVGNTIFFDLTNIAAHASGQIVFQGMVAFATPVGRVLTNFSQILCSQNDADFSDNTSTWLTTVTAGCVMPTITGNPADAVKCPGDSVTFTVAASGTAPLSYQWRKNGGAISGATGSSYTINPVAASDSGTYDVVVTNACGSATSSGAVLDANDTTPPTISCPADVSVAANAGCAATNVSLGMPTTSDNCSVAAVTNDSPTIFPLGTNVVTWTVVDASGNVNSCAQQVIVRDAMLPSITCPGDLVFSADVGQCSHSNITFTVLAADNCAIANLTSVPASGSTFPVGTTTVTNTATDASGNTATCTFTVTVTDTEPPVVICPTNIVMGADSGECSRSQVQFTVNATDNCAVTNLTSTPPSGSTFPVGTTTVTNVATDASGNTATCTFTVTVVAETIVTIPPVDQTACEGGTASFNIVATGAGLTYQWSKNGGNLGGETNSTLTLTNISFADAGTYCVVVSGACGSPVTNCATLAVNQNVIINAHPTDRLVCPGENVNFSVSAAGTALAFQWFKDGNVLTNETSNLLRLTNVTVGDAGTYCVTVSGACGDPQTDCATLTVRTPVSAVGPTNQTLCPDGLIVFSTVASGTGPFRYQWRLNGQPLTSATNSTLNISTTNSGTRIYSVVVSGPCKDSVTNSATLTVLTTVTATELVNQTACPGSSVVFGTLTGGTGPFTYQWLRSPSPAIAPLPLPGETNSALLLRNVSLTNAGIYCVMVSGACGSLTRCATLTVLTNTTAGNIINPTNVCPGDTVTFSITPTGTGPFTYQWRRGPGGTPITPIPGATNSLLTLTNVTSANFGFYSVSVTGACGSVFRFASLLVGTNTQILSGPTNLTRCSGSGEAAVFRVSAAGSGLTYQWFKNGNIFTGRTNSTLTITNLSTENAGTYCVRVAGTCGAPVTNCATLTIISNTVLLTPPHDQTVCPGATAHFSVTAGGSGLAYQWSKNGGDLVGETGSALTLTNVSAGSAGHYCVVVSGECGSPITNCAVLTVLTNVSATGPFDQTVCPGATAVFSTTAGGTGPFTYQWRKGGVALTGETNSTLTLPGITTNSAGLYAVTVNGACGNVTVSALLSVSAQVTILQSPVNRTNCAGTTASFAVLAEGPGLNYQWFKNGDLLAGITGSTLTLTNVSASDGGTYCVRIAGTCPDPVSGVTNCATLTVISSAVIVTPPNNQTVCPGAMATFSVAASGTGLSYQWRFNGTNIAGATGSSYSRMNVQPADAGVYVVIVTGACGNTETRTATLALNPPVSASAPGNLLQNPGTTATFSTTASGTGTLTYQWKKDGGAINGETASSLVISNISSADEGTYSVMVSDACGSVEVSGTLTINQPPAVAITTPTNGAVIVLPQDVTISAAANDSDGSVTNVEIFVGTNLVGSSAFEVGSSNVIFETIWTNPPAGTYELRARALDNLGLSATSAPVTITVQSSLPLIVVSNIFLNRQSGYYEEIVRVFNPTPFASNTVGVLVFGVHSPIQVVNMTALVNGIPYVQNGNLIPSGGFADIKIKFYVPLNVTNIAAPVLVAVVMPAVATASVNGTPVTITRIKVLADNSVLLNFQTIIGPIYFVEYSDDMILWTTSPQTVAGTGFTAQWIDDGPPATGALPMPPQRAYRVSRVP